MFIPPTPNNSFHFSLPESDCRPNSPAGLVKFIRREFFPLNPLIGNRDAGIKVPLAFPQARWVDRIVNTKPPNYS